MTLASIRRSLLPLAVGFALLLAHRPAAASPRGYLYACGYSGVDVYAAGVARPKLLAQLTNGMTTQFYPDAVTVGPHGVVYVESSEGSGIYEYRRGSTAPFRELPQVPQYFPLGSLSVGRDGSIYELSASDQTASRVVIERSPTGAVIRTIDFGIVGIDAFVTDAAGNLYVSGAVPGEVVVYAPGASVPSAELNSHNAGGLAFDGRGDLLIGSDDAIRVVTVPRGVVARRIPIVGYGGALAVDKAQGIVYALAASNLVEFFTLDQGRQVGFLTGYPCEFGVDDGSEP
jgi:hypothetical protein